LAAAAAVASQLAIFGFHVEVRLKAIGAGIRLQEAHATPGMEQSMCQHVASPGSNSSLCQSQQQQQQQLHVPNTAAAAATPCAKHSSSSSSNSLCQTQQQQQQLPVPNTAAAAAAPSAEYCIAALQLDRFATFGKVSFTGRLEQEASSIMC
jgi:hypothetical protein